MSKTLLYIIKVLVSIGITYAAFSIFTKLLDLFITTESQTTIDAIYMIVFILLYTAVKEVIEELMEPLLKLRKAN